MDFPSLFVIEVRRRDDPKGEPFAHVIVQIKEEYEYLENEVRTAKLTINYCHVNQKSHTPIRAGGFFHASYARRYGHDTPMVSLTSHGYGHGAVFLDLPGLDGNRVGSFLLYLVVQWVKQWPAADVHPIELLPEQGQGVSGKIRNAFYQNINLQFESLEDQSKRIYSKPITVEGLRVNTSWQQNIKAMSMFEFISHSTMETSKWQFEHEYAVRQLRQTEMEHKFWARFTLIYWIRHFCNRYFG